MASNSATINPDVIKRTKGSLGALITKPALTDKLLSKPPFRFLHDILTEILRNTGFLYGLFTEEEMNSENVKDKDRKVLFLQKVIDVLMFATGQKLKVKPSRIVAGAEAEKTNEMLQLVAYCVQKKINSSEAVKKVLSGEKPFSGQDKTEDKARPALPPGREKEAKGSDSDLTSVRSRVKLPENEGNRQRGTEEERKRRGERARRERRDPSEEERGKKRDPSEEKVRRREVSEERLKRGTSRDGRRPPAPEQPAQRDPSPPPPEREVLPDAPESSPPNPRQRPASAKRSRRHEPESLPEPGTLPPNNSHISMGEGEPNPPPKPPPGALADAGSSSDNEQAMEAPAPMMSRPPIRPSTARRAPPKRRESSLEGAERILSGKEGPKVYLDSELDQDDTEEQFIVQDTADTLALAADRELEDEEGQQGALTKKLFETKKHLEGDLVQDGEQGFVNEAQRHKQKEVAQKEIGQMQQAIQSICQNVSPLSKIIDFIHEDLESMRNELEKWRKESSKHSAALLKEEAAAEEGLLPFKEQMEKLETQMVEVRENIRTSRYNYYQNEDRIKKLIEGISFASQQ